MMRSAIIVLLMLASPARAQDETVRYTYDALGRVTEATVTAGAATGTSTAIKYDAAGNRDTYTVSGYQGPANQNGSPDGGTTTGAQGDGGVGINPRRVFIVVPLNGFTLIPVM